MLSAPAPRKDHADGWGALGPTRPEGPRVGAGDEEGARARRLEEQLRREGYKIVAFPGSTRASTK